MAIELPLVSVHVVTYNQQDFIHETLTSILDQDYSHLQIVVSDDGSADATPIIVDDYAKRYPDRIVAITGGTNLGISGNSNRCLRRCTGKYVAFLAGDDLMLPGKISKQVAWFEADARRALCAHDVEHFDSRSGKTLRTHHSIVRPRTGYGTADFLRWGYYSATSSVMVRRSVMPAYGFDERIRVHSDWKFAADCLVHGGAFGYVPGILGRYRLHDRNSTSIFSETRWTERHVGLAILEAEHPELAPACATARAYAYLQRAVSLVQCGQSAEARSAFERAIRHDPLVSWKLPAWWALSFVPPRLLPRRLRQAVGQTA
jgi:glycosyltransferase involved in cell wall biosynthesis